LGYLQLFKGQVGLGQQEVERNFKGAKRAVVHEKMSGFGSITKDRISSLQKARKGILRNAADNRTQKERWKSRKRQELKINTIGGGVIATERGKGMWSNRGGQLQRGG